MAQDNKTKLTPGDTPAERVLYAQLLLAHSDVERLTQVLRWINDGILRSHGECPICEAHVMLVTIPGDRVSKEINHQNWCPIYLELEAVINEPQENKSYRYDFAGSVSAYLDRLRDK